MVRSTVVRGIMARRIVVRSILVLALLWGGTPAVRTIHADEDDPYAGVLRAARDGQHATVVRLVAEADLDPWRVVDRFVRAGMRTAASRLASTVRNRDAPALAAYAKRAPAREADQLALLIDVSDLCAGGDHASAVKRLTEWRPNELTVLTVLLHEARADCHLALDSPERALAAFRDMREAASRLGWLRLQFGAIEGRIHVLGDLGRYAEARESVRALHGIAAKIGRPLDERQVDRLEAHIELSSGAPRAALAPLRRALAWFEAQELLAETASARVNLGVAYGHLGLFAQALRACELAEDEARRAKDPEVHAHARHTRIAVLIDMGRYDEAIDRSDAFLASTELEPADAALLRANLGRAYVRTGKLEQARKSLADARAGFEASGVAEHVGWLHMYRALVLHVESGDWAAALRDCDEAVKRLEPGTNDFAWTMFTRGIALIGKAKWSGAAAALASARTIAEKQMMLDLGASVQGRLAEIALARGDAPAALHHARAAMALMDESTLGLADEEDVDVRSDAERARVFRTWARAARASGDVAGEFEALEAGRARLLVRAMGGAHLARGLDLDPELQAKERSAQRRLVSARERYLVSVRRYQSYSHARVVAARGRRDEAQRALDALIAQVQRHAGARAALAYPAAADLAAYQQTLWDDEAVVLYDVADEGATALVVTKGAARSVRIADWDDVRKACDGMLEVDNEVTLTSFEAATKRFQRRLLDDLELPKGIRHVHVSTAGPLTVVPWSALPAVQAGRIAVSACPSALALQAARAIERNPVEIVASGGAPRYDDAAFALGDPLYEKERGGRPIPWRYRGRHLGRLAHSGDESADLKAKHLVRLVREAATETALKRHLAGPHAWRVIHLGCHGFIDDAKPGLSCLALSPSAEDDGFLTASEVFQLKIRARLVVLSACQVGRSRYQPGVGLLGLVRAFLAAGCPRVLSSIWNCDDAATAVLMRSFHAERAAGKTVPEALRAAQATVRATKPKWKAPYYWAGWVLWGDV